MSSMPISFIPNSTRSVAVNGNTNRTSAQDDIPYDGHGAMLFIVATIVVYGTMGLIWTIMIRIKKSSASRYVDDQDEYTQKYLKEERKLKLKGYQSKLRFEKITSEVVVADYEKKEKVGEQVTADEGYCSAKKTSQKSSLRKEGSHYLSRAKQGSRRLFRHSERRQPDDRQKKGNLSPRTHDIYTLGTDNTSSRSLKLPVMDRTQPLPGSTRELGPDFRGAVSKNPLPFEPITIVVVPDTSDFDRQNKDTLSVHGHQSPGKIRDGHKDSSTSLGQVSLLLEEEGGGESLSDIRLADHSDEAWQEHIEMTNVGHM